MSLRDGMTPKMKPVSPRRSAIVAVLDIGTSKAVCMIARLKPQSPKEVLRRRSHGVEILGLGHVVSRGIKSGAVIDLAEAEAAVRHAVDLAERDASVQLESVVVSISAGRIGSELYAATINVAGSAISEGDIGRVLTAGSDYSVRQGRVLLHSLPIGYSLDGVRGIGEPRGMLAREFGVDIHAVTCDTTAARNLMLTVERCHLTVETMVAAPYVAGLGVLADDEADLGAALVDLGAGTTTIAVFSSGRFIHADGFALGGQHVTMDLARGLNAPIAEAERIKTLYGSVMAGGSDDRDMVSVPRVGDDEREPPQFVSRANLVNIIKPRIEEILEMVRDRLAAALAGDLHRRRQPAHRTGGACRQHPQSPGPHRPAARHLRIAGGCQGTGLRRGCGTSGLPAGGAPRTLRTAANAASHDRDRLRRSRRPMAPGELLMTGTKFAKFTHRPAADRHEPAASSDAVQ
jgi:cell division protein FtsA